MKKWNVVLGVDVSKLTLDICCADLNKHVKVDNNSKGFAVFKKWCKGLGIDLSKTIIVLEFTGGYEYRFLQFCESLSIDYCRLPGLEIKNSMGMTRGKNDQADAYRIRQYGQDRVRRLEPSNPIRPDILNLKQLISFRKKLVRENAGLQSFVNERRHMYELPENDPILLISQKKIEANNQDIKQVEKAIKEAIKSDESMWCNYRIISSIKGIGKVNAWMTIAYTENFTSFTDPRKYAVFVGVIPFGKDSGTSLKGRKKFSHLAHKELKQELNQAAKTAAIHDPEIRAYAERKLKNKVYPLVLNNVKFKLILRMFSLVKRGEMYVENYRRAA